MNAKKADLPTSARRNTLEEIEQAIHSLDRNPRMPENIFENSNSSEEGKEDGDNDDDIQVVKADIFKFHGQEETSLERQVSEGILKFEYRFEDPMDDDIIEIDVIDKKKRKSSSDMITLDNDEDNDVDDDEEEEEKDGKWEEEGNVVIWKVEEKKEDKKEKLEEPKSKKFKQFGEGNFFMLAE